MQLRRPQILMLEHRERPQFSLESLLAGGAGVVSTSVWLALAPHLGEEVELELDDLPVFDAVTTGDGVAREALEARFGVARVSRLVDAGLLIGDQPAHAGLRERDRLLRETSWWAPAAVAHAFGRWQGVDVSAEEASKGKRKLRDLIAGNGPPPEHSPSVRAQETWRRLPAPEKTPLDELLARRSTCRNFDGDAGVSLGRLGSLLHRVFGAQAAQEPAVGAVMLKKNSPSGGGLHPIEAYLLAQRVDGLAPGLYHYHSSEHALEPMRLLSAAELPPLAHELVAGQPWFAQAPVLVLMAARFQRNFWKYRNHPKSLKVILLDAGHLSQNLYLAATELGYGAFVTGAINDQCAERMFELDGLATGAVAVCGFGPRARELVNIEFDPLGKAVR